nr:RagB/SusD family nutrient uptake outer membrane protein [Paraflavitalea speifideiaquila]
MYLIAAEAEARLNGPTQIAHDNINMVRGRAGIPNLATSLTKEQFVDAVLQERGWEFLPKAIGGMILQEQIHFLVKFLLQRMWFIL